MNALNVIGVASNLMFFVIVIAGVLAMLDERKINCLQALFYFLMVPIGIIPIELIERVKFIKAPLRLNPCRLGKAYESDKSRHPE